MTRGAGPARDSSGRGRCRSGARPVRSGRLLVQAPGTRSGPGPEGTRPAALSGEDADAEARVSAPLKDLG
ncbi:hypothetical protein ACFYT4_06480 [Streptomyces sp. NPDC004609]|uniref:hypothetical protein n=1 Tax=Streptomyces sp. NPDC004609 TaxID=3364704 RepID=UPI0036BC5ACE